MSNEIRSVEIEAEAAKHLLAAIAETIGDDDQAAHDAVEGETGLMEAIDRALERMVMIDAMLTGLDAHKQVVSRRIERLEAGERRLREVLLKALYAAKQRKIERPLATLSIGKTRGAVAIDDEDLLPVWLKRWKGWEPDKAAITAALKAGPVTGASMVGAGVDTLVVRGL